MAINRELSQFASFVEVDTNKNISIAATDGNNVGIGTTLPRQKLDVVGLSRFENTQTTGIATVGFATVTSGFIGVATVGVLSVTNTTIENINVTGIITTPQLDIKSPSGQPGPAVLGIASVTGLDVTGISTFKNSSSRKIVEIGTASTDFSLEGKLTLRLSETIGGITTTGLKGQVLLTDGEGNIGFGTASSFFANRIYVSEAAGNDSNDGSRLAVRTIKKAAQLASLKNEPTAIFVESGEYIEDNPIILYEDVALIGDNVRNTIIRPQNPNQDLFRVRNGSYVSNFAIKDAVSSGVPQHTWNYAVSFDDIDDATTSRVGYAVTSTKPIITRSPYVQNCSIISFLGGNGVLVDGSKVNSVNTPAIPEEAENPVIGPQPEQGKSIVANAFTMVSFGGVGWRCINDGYAQIVSCFQIFCQDGSLTESGGYLSITNSATNFGTNALRSKGFSRNSFLFDRGIISEHGISDVNQTLKVVGLGRIDQDQYILRFENTSGQDVTNDFKPVGVAVTFDGIVGVDTTTDVINSPSHGLVNGNTIAYYSNISGSIGGLSTVTQYYVEAVDSNNIKLFLDDSLTVPVDLTSTNSGIHTFRIKDLEFFASEIKETSHNDYQRLVLSGGPYTFNNGQSLIQSVGGGNYAYGYVVNYDSVAGSVIVSNEIYTGSTKYSFSPSGGTLLDHVGSTVTLTSVSGISTYYTTDIIVKSVPGGQLISNIGILTTGYRLNYHRPSIINSSSHTWEYAGSGNDYNALPQNGGSPDPSKEQVSQKGGQVYASGTNELGDFKIGNFITAKNRTGNITFTNTVTIGNLSALTLGVGGVTVGSISDDPDLGDNDAGGPSNSRLTTQLAQRSFLNNRLGYFIDKTASTNSVPNSVVVLNSSGKINSDLLPPATSSNFYYVFPGTAVTTRTSLVDDIPAKNILNGDIVVENNGISTTSYQLFNDADSQYLVLSDSTRNYNFINGDIVTSVNENAIGIVTTPTSVGYGTSGFVKGVCLNVSIVSGGSGYTSGIYTGVSIGSSTGIGTDIVATIAVGGSNEVANVDLSYGGRGYQVGDILELTSGVTQVGGSNAIFQISEVESRLYLDLLSSIKFNASSDVPNFTIDGDAIGLSTSLTDQYSVSFTSNTSVDTVNDTIVIGSHNFSDGDPVYYDNGGNVNIGGLTSGEIYYVKTVGISSVELHSNYHLNAVKDLTSVSAGIHSLTRKTVSIEDDTIVLLNHGYSTGDVVNITGSVPVGLTTGTNYYVGSATTNSFTLHQTRSSSLVSVGGTTITPINLTATGTGIVTFTKQNVEFDQVINTSSSDSANYTVITASNIDASNIISGIINPDRLGTGIAAADTFLSGDSSYKKVASGVGIATTQPLTITGSSGFSGPSGGFTTYFGNVNISLNRADLNTSAGDDYGNLGVSRFKKSNFVLSSDGAVRLKTTAEGGDVDAKTLSGNESSYYLNPSNLSSTIPVNKGGTGLTTAIPAGGVIQANGSGFVITRTPNFNLGGVGISSITADYFNGTLTGVAQSLSNAANIVTGTISNDRLPTNINLTAGIVTSGRFIATDRIETTSIVSTSSTITIDPGTIGDDTGTVRIRGNLVVDGDTTTINSINLDVNDKLIGISSTASPDDSTTADQSGISVYGTTLKTLLYNNSSTSWKSNQDFDLASSKVYKINGASVLSSNTLGSGVVNSSLTSLGTLSNLGVSTTGIGTIPVADITTNLKTTQITEKANIVAAAAGGDYNLGSNGVVYYHNVNSTANWTPNFRWDSSTTLSSMVTTGQSVTVTIISSQNANFYSNAITIDGVSGLPTRWSGGTSPTFGSTVGVDIYTYTLLRTGSGSSDWFILASRTQYAS